MKALSFFRSTLAFASISALFVSSTALADEAVVVVGGPYAEPPPRAVQPIEPRTSYEPRYDRDDLYERRRSPVRVALGPSFLTTGQGLGVGLGVGLELGSGMVGGRLGVFEGHGGDLRIGLPWQLLHDGTTLRHTRAALVRVHRSTASHAERGD